MDDQQLKSKKKKRTIEQKGNKSVLGKTRKKLSTYDTEILTKRR